jgi:hypothetical protein
MEEELFERLRVFVGMLKVLKTTKRNILTMNTHARAPQFVFLII